MNAEIRLAASCVARTNHDNSNLRGWDIGCPQQDGGTADPATAAARDITALTNMHRAMLQSDSTLHRDLGGPAPSAGNGS